ncbi:hypothetical protein [Allokutzneria oryzae]|uniref:Uncharacterized protein n=1 Tax=Allokutzneria oryzae TaxID=1378989 RepID=A0ABV6A7G2_9PSEU
MSVPDRPANIAWRSLTANQTVVFSSEGYMAAYTVGRTALMVALETKD